ncbi:MAG: hypothetical protein J6S67_07705 [Methanobrevibacter sp.]|nr:hypothetical protein [Methanobrevibacter sp.]
MDNEMTNYIPRVTYNGEDCLIIPLRQIIEIKINSSVEVVPEMELRIRGVMQND